MFIFAGRTFTGEVYPFMLTRRISGDHTIIPTGYEHNDTDWGAVFQGFALVMTMFLVFAGCAKVGKPMGGPKDLNPPLYVEGTPENRSVNFSGDEIDITFDEYIQVKDIAREMIISPPLKKRPLTRIREKTIRITLNNELLPQTTYTINFGNAISDLNEGNIIPDFEFVFSTGNTIDSLSVTGKAINAFDRKPAKNEEVLVMLYENLNDSAPLLEIPRYIGKASKDGLFSVNNIHADTFRILALKDLNNNRLYDPGGEAIAFLDSFLIIHPGNVTPVTFIKDTIRIIHPATKARRSGKQGSGQPADTTIAPGKLLNALSVSLLYFQEVTNKVIVNSKNRNEREELVFTFNRPPHDTIKLKPLNFSTAINWYIREQSRQGDTLTYWITDTTIAAKDTLNLIMSYMTTDTANRFVERSDTISLRFKLEPAVTSSTRKTKNVAPAVKKPASMKLYSTLANKGIQNLNKPVVFTISRPLKSINPNAIEFSRIRDSITSKQPFTVIRDTFNIRTFSISCNWEEDLMYKLLLKPGAVSDIYGLTNDSVELTFNTQKIDYYGRILLTIGSDHFPLLVQLLDDKEKIVDQKVVTQSGLTAFEYLIPRKYILKAVYDKNENLRWDTGNYLKHIQPEQVFYHIMPDPVRSNWDHEVMWKIED